MPESLVTRLLTKLGDIYSWQNASKACFIALGTTLAPILFALWFGAHYLQFQSSGYVYIPFTEVQLLSAFENSIGLAVYMFLISVLARSEERRVGK